MDRDCTLMNMPGMVRSKLPSGWMHWFLRMPIWFYRLHLGWLLGQRLLLLTHRGRKSGQWRQTVVEVVTHDERKVWYICSGWGTQANWFQNILQDSRVRIQVGSQQFNGTAEILERSAAQAVLERYAHSHPAAFGKLFQMMLGEKLSEAESATARLAAAVPVVAITVV